MKGIHKSSSEYDVLNCKCNSEIFLFIILQMQSRAGELINQIGRLFLIEPNAPDLDTLNFADALDHLGMHQIWTH
jgi:hypothetical protein